jgi:hypothetical protein
MTCGLRWLIICSQHEFLIWSIVYMFWCIVFSYIDSSSNQCNLTRFTISTKQDYRAIRSYHYELYIYPGILLYCKLKNWVRSDYIITLLVVLTNCKDIWSAHGRPEDNVRGICISSLHIIIRFSRKWVFRGLWAKLWQY